MPVRVRLEAALIFAGLDPMAVDFDHDPALGLRPLNARGTDTVPPANDPRYIVPRARATHKQKTHGDPAIPRSGDLSKIRHADRLELAEKEHKKEMALKRPARQAMRHEASKAARFHRMKIKRKWPVRKMGVSRGN
jgi:hypothetical protein